MIAPASRSLRTTGASKDGTSFRILEPAVHLTPRMYMMSLMATGTPSRGPRGEFESNLACDSFADSRADSFRMVMKQFNDEFRSSILPRR